jgi:hypothetical protein
VGETEREIARHERQQAVELRQLDARYHSGPPLPRLPGTGHDRENARTPRGFESLSLRRSEGFTDC